MNIIKDIEPIEQEPTIFETMSRAEINELRHDIYQKSKYFVDSILNIDIEQDPEFLVDSFSVANGLSEGDMEEGILEIVDKMETLGVPNSLIDDYLDEDDAISANALEETRQFLADSYLDDYEPRDIADSLYMADWGAVFGKCSSQDEKTRTGHSGQVLYGKDTTANGRPTCTYMPKGGAKKSTANMKKRGSSDRVHHDKPEYVETIAKATEFHKKKAEKKGTAKSNNSGFSDSFQDYLTDGAKSKSCRPRDSKHECKSVVDPKTGNIYKEEVVKEKYQGTLNKALSRKKRGRKLSASALAKRKRNLEKFKEQREKARELNK